MNRAIFLHRRPLLRRYVRGMCVRLFHIRGRHRRLSTLSMPRGEHFARETIIR